MPVAVPVMAAVGRAGWTKALLTPRRSRLTVSLAPGWWEAIEQRAAKNVFEKGSVWDAPTLLPHSALRLAPSRPGPFPPACLSLTCDVDPAGPRGGDVHAAKGADQDGVAGAAGARAGGDGGRRGGGWGGLEPEHSCACRKQQPAGPRTAHYPPPTTRPPRHLERGVARHHLVDVEPAGAKGGGRHKGAHVEAGSHVHFGACAGGAAAGSSGAAQWCGDAGRSKEGRVGTGRARMGCCRRSRVDAGWQGCGHW